VERGGRGISGPFFFVLGRLRERTHCNEIGSHTLKPKPEGGKVEEGKIKSLTL
jgi:hypothetical protein